jgi:rhamnosyltransferase
VTYHPAPGHLANVLRVRPQVRKLVVVDNCSSERVLGAFREASQGSEFHLIENGENLGVAAALNIGIRWAESSGCDWVILFDQDSTVSDGLVETMLSAHDSELDREYIGTLAPVYVDRSSGNEMPVERSKNGEIVTAPTSGSLIPVSIFAGCGYFREDFFIDQVDFEFCLRILAAGYRIVQCADASLVHSLGERREYDIGGMHLLTSTHHNARRRYYIVRNRVVLLRLYWRRFPRYCFGLIRTSVKDTIKILLVEREKVSKLKNTAKGIADGLLGWLGKRVEL